MFPQCLFVFVFCCFCGSRKKEENHSPTSCIQQEMKLGERSLIMQMVRFGALVCHMHDFCRRHIRSHSIYFSLSFISIDAVFDFLLPFIYILLKMYFHFSVSFRILLLLNFLSYTKFQMGSFCWTIKRPPLFMDHVSYEQAALIFLHLPSFRVPTLLVSSVILSLLRHQQCIKTQLTFAALHILIWLKPFNDTFLLVHANVPTLD